MELHHEEIEAAGLRIVAIGLGQPKHAARFGKKLAPSALCLTQEKPDVYDEFGIGRGNRLRMIAPDALAAGARAAARGFTQGTGTGDSTRLTATFVVDQSGTVRYAYYGKHAGDHVDLDDLLAAWQAQAPGRGLDG